MTAAAALAGRAAANDEPCGLLAGRALAGPAARLAAGLEPGFLGEIGWDPAAQVIAPSPGHPRLRDTGRWAYATAPLEAAGGCAAAGCGRQVSAPGRVLCREHRRRQRVAGDLPLEQFLALPQASALPPTGPCQVTACLRERTSHTRYCEAHQYQMRIARQQDGSGFDEDRWRALAPPVPVGGQVSLRGLPPLLAAEVLYGLQQRTGEGVTTRLHVLRALVEDLRRSRAASLEAAGPASGPMAREKSHILHSLRR